MADLIAFVSYVVRRGVWAPVLVLLVDSILDYYFDIYAKFPNIDIVSHFLGGAAIAYLVSVAYRAPKANKFLGTHSKFSFFLFTITATSLVCITWEFAEWLSDQYLGTNHQLGIDDTMGDFFFGLLAAVVVGAITCRSVE